MYTTTQTYRKKLYFIILTALIILTTSCGLFDKELEQDKHIARFRHQMSRVYDSLPNNKDRVKAFETILQNINTDKALITPRKKNMLLIEGNTYLSNQYLNMENYSKALECINLTITIDSVAPKGYYSRGYIYQIQDKDSLALLNYDQAIKLNPDYTDAYYNRGIIYEELEMYNLALMDYTKAIKLRPSYIKDIYNNRGNTYLAKEVFDKAIEDYTKVLNIDTANVKAYSNRAGAYIMQKELEKALKDCDKAILLDSININAYNKRASIYEAKKEYDKAINDYEKIIELDPKNKLGIQNRTKESIQKLKPHVKKK